MQSLDGDMMRITRHLSEQLVQALGVEVEHQLRPDLPQIVDARCLRLPACCFFIGGSH